MNVGIMYHMEDLHTKLDRILALLERTDNPPPNYLQDWYDAKDKAGQYTLTQLKKELRLTISDARLGRDLRTMPFVSVKRKTKGMVYCIH